MAGEPYGGSTLLPSDDTGFRIRFPSTEGQKAGRNQMHLDLTSTSLEDQQQTVARSLKLGARRSTSANARRRVMWYSLTRRADGHSVDSALPVESSLGISFFTFQVIGYLVDVYRRELSAERSILVFAVFKAFFAQLVAGPIVRANELTAAAAYAKDLQCRPTPYRVYVC